LPRAELKRANDSTFNAFSMAAVSVIDTALVKLMEEAAI
jgi:hypothetical protein